MDNMIAIAILIEDYNKVDRNKEPLKKCRLAIEIIRLGGDIEYGK